MLSDLHMAKPPRLLLIAYACAPHRGSEWGLSWNFARELARKQPVSIITHMENQSEIDAHLASNTTEFPIDVRYVTLPHWMNRLGARAYALFNVQYLFWQRAAARAARQTHAAQAFDIVHHVSLVRWWMPSAGATLATRHGGAMFIFGPVGGGEPMPKRFRGGIGLRARLSELIRNVAVGVWSLDPTLRRCVRRASLVIACTPHAATRLARYRPERLETLAAAVTSSPAIVGEARAYRAARPAGQRFRVMSSGGLSYYRGVDLCLRAFAKASLPDAEYLHTSDGPDRARLEALAVSLGIADRVRFLGDQPHAENVKAVATADVYMHAVLRDSQGLIPDAMSLGIPVLTLDQNTMSLLVNESCGHKVPMDKAATPERVVDEMARVLRHWHDDPVLRERLGSAGVARAEQFTPAGRTAIFRAMYARLMDAGQHVREPLPVRAAAYPGKRLGVRGH
jgi:glycosyltransferase involved in cell wall biosynthesis